MAFDIILYYVINIIICASAVIAIQLKFDSIGFSRFNHHINLNDNFTLANNGKLRHLNNYNQSTLNCNPSELATISKRFRNLGNILLSFFSIF